MAQDAGTRSYFLDDYLDEVAPCASTLDGWAQWLSKPDESWEHDIPADGAVFTGSAILWQDDIVATRVSGSWSLSREPAGEDFVAVRYAAGAGWSADNIIYPGCAFASGPGSDIVPTQTMAEALLVWLADSDDCCDDVEYVAVGTQENGWVFTYSGGPPPTLEAARVS